MRIHVVVCNYLSRGTTLLPLRVNSSELKKIGTSYIFISVLGLEGARGSVVVKALCYKLEGRGFDSR
jgi:hypothetical protein